MPRKSLVLSLRSIYETLAISWPTVVDAALGRVTKKTCDDRLAGWARKVVQASGMSLDVSGRDHVEPHKAYLVMSNHQSHYDIPVLFHVLGANIRMIAKVELFDLPIFGPAIREAGFIAIDRSNRNRAIESLAVARKTLEGGTNVWIAPEGTRSRTGELLPFKKGGFVLALETGWPVLPITIQGTRDILPAKGVRSTPGQSVKVVIHAPIDPARYVELAAKEKRPALMKDVRTLIESALCPNL
jgi:1-acyl-sn-glycerol-3-phosphate acyltransferase